MKLLTLCLCGKAALGDIENGEFVDCTVSTKETAKSLLDKDEVSEGEIIIQVEIKSIQEIFMPEESLRARELK